MHIALSRAETAVTAVMFDESGTERTRVVACGPWGRGLGGPVGGRAVGGAVEFGIRAYARAGRKLRRRGRGVPGSGSTPAGDQIVELEVLAPRAHSDAEREAYRTLRDSFGDDWRRE